MARGNIQTHAQWLACKDPNPLLTVLARYGPPSSRKARLYACTAARRTWQLLDNYFRQALEAAERYADGEMSKSEFEHSLIGFREAFNQVWYSVDGDVIGNMRAARFRAPYFAVQCAVQPDGQVTGGQAMDWVRMLGPQSQTKPWQCDIIRDMFGNPLRPATIHPSWRSNNVIALAQAIYTDRAFDRLPILADALEDAGCDNADILNHCRQPGEHVRGCWVVDLVLGKA
jgi:hypothetical protein